MALRRMHEDLRKVRMPMTTPNPATDAEVAVMRRSTSKSVHLAIGQADGLLARLDAERARADANEALLLEWDQDIDKVQDQLDAALAENAKLRAALEAIAAPAPEYMMPDIDGQDEAEMLRLVSRRRRDMAREALKPKGEMK